MPLFASLAVLSFSLLGNLDPGALCAQPLRPRPGGTVYVGAGLSPENVVVLSAAVAAAGDDAVLLLDGPDTAAPNDAFVRALGPPRVVPVGTFADPDALVDRFGDVVERPRPWGHGPPRRLRAEFFPRAEAVVVCPAASRRLLLHAGCLAGVLKAPLFVHHGRPSETRELNECLARWKCKTVYALGTVYPQSRQTPGVAVTRLAGEKEVAALYLERLARGGPVRTLVVANPADARDGLSMSGLAPWVALSRHAALLLTNDKGTNVEKLVHAALKRKALRHADTLLLVADLEAIPLRERPNPVPGDKDEKIEMEPLTPRGTEPFSFSVGRLFHKDPAVAALLVARRHLLARHSGTPRALVASNAGNSLPLLETFSRNTVRELRYCGYDTTGVFGGGVSKELLQRELPKHDLFLWEGHHNTLINDWSFPEWKEPLPPSLLFLQSCLALMDYKVQPALANGAVGVIGSSTRMYSASGGACSLCFVNGLAYEGLTVGESLRQAKNFLLAYALLKEKRLGKDAKRTGANVRAAWAFSLWGDPTLRLPRPEKETKALPPVRQSVRGHTITLTLPRSRHEPVVSKPFEAAPHPDGRLGGLVRKKKGEEGRPLVPLVFVEVKLPKGPAGKVPQLSSRLPGKNWVFNWDARRRSGYLLAVPREKDTGEIRFRVRWVAPAEQTAGSR